jgi:hypothetical protein
MEVCGSGMDSTSKSDKYVPSDSALSALNP